MGFKKGEGGRQKGAQNKKTLEAEEIIARFKLDPLEFLMRVVNNDWKGLGYDSPTTTSYSPAGVEFEEPVIPFSDRVSSAKEAAKYRYSQKRAVELSNPDGQGFRVIVEDYGSKK